ncbi:MAG: OB-fold nucleic acid binding domain-containing protein, partial [Acidimicrobiales bacterium]
RKYRGFWHRILHDQTADAIERDISQLPHANVTTVPFHIGPHGEPDEGLVHAEGDRSSAALPHPEPASVRRGRVRESREGPATPATVPSTSDVTRIAEVKWRQRVTVEGRVTTLRVQPARGSDSLECVIEDSSGTMSVVFTGRHQIGGVDCGSRLRARGTVSIYKGRLAIFNPVYTLLSSS